MIPLLQTLPDIAGQTLTVDALLTQRKLARYLLERGAHYVFTAKGNQKLLLEDIALWFDTAAPRPPDFEEQATLSHGRIEQRALWTTTQLNAHVNFPGVGQVFMLRRSRQHKHTGERSTETVYGVTSHTPDTAHAQRLLRLNRGHWCIENRLHYVRDFTYDEDRCRAHVGNLPRNLACLTNAAISIVRHEGRFEYLPPRQPTLRRPTTGGP